MPAPLAPEILACLDGTTIAYRRQEAAPDAGGLPGVVFLGGFRSDMTGTKASFLAEFCARRGLAYVRFDYFGHGGSAGDFADGSIGRWRADALNVLDALSAGPQLLVGSSMGGWIALLAALARPQRVAGVVAVAAAPDFTEELMWNALGATERQLLLAEGAIMHTSAYDGIAYPVTRRLIEEGRRHLLLGGPIALGCPVRLLHGMADADVPWQTSLRLAERLAGTDAVLTLVKDGDHRMSRPEDLERLGAMVAELSAAAASAARPAR